MPTPFLKRRGFLFWLLSAGRLLLVIATFWEKGKLVTSKWQPVTSNQHLGFVEWYKSVKFYTVYLWGEEGSLIILKN
jgi:hypothetical protein